MTNAHSTFRFAAARWIAGLLCCAGVAANAAAGSALDCPRFPEPEARLQWVAQYIVYNGVPMSIKHFDSELSPAQVLAFYRNAWRAGGAGPAAIEYTVAPWQTIAVARGKCFFTVQVQPAGSSGSTGLLSATEAPDGPRLISHDADLPMMSGSTILNDIQHRDDGKNARTLLLTNGFSAQSNADFYRQTLADQGWRAVSGYEMTTARGPGITLVLKRGLAETSLVITHSDGKTTVLANMVDRP